MIAKTKYQTLVFSCVVMIVLVASSCGVPSTSQFVQINESDIPFELNVTTTSTTTTTTLAERTAGS